MWFIPYRKLVLKTYLSPERVTKKIGAIVYQDSTMSRRLYGVTKKPFLGKLTSNGFEIRRRRSRDFLSPVIKGTIRPEAGSCTIAIIIRPSVIMLAICAPVICFAFFAFAQDIRNGTGSAALNDFSVLGIFLLISYIFPTFVFYMDSVHSTELLSNTLDAYGMQETSFFKRDDLT